MLEHSLGWAFKTLDGAGTFLGMGIQNTGWCWNIPWHGHSKHWMVLEHSMGWAFRTLDGAGTFHGMGIQNTGWCWNIPWDGHSKHVIGAATPGTKHRKAIRREVTATLASVLCTMDKVFIRYFDSSVVDLPLVYEAVLQNFTAEDKSKILYIPWKVSRPLSRLVSDDAECLRRDISWSQSFPFLPMIDMDPTNMSCIFLHSSLALRYGATPVLIFDQPCGGKPRRSLTMSHLTVPRSIVLRVGGFHTEMSSLGCMGRLTAGSGLQQLLEVVFAQNSVTHMLPGKAIARAVRGHFLAYAILIAELYRVRVATKCKTYRFVQTDYASK